MEGPDIRAFSFSLTRDSMRKIRVSVRISELQGGPTAPAP
jgi:hypothetical protein